MIVTTAQKFSDEAIDESQAAEDQLLVSAFDLIDGPRLLEMMDVVVDAPAAHWKLHFPLQTH